MNEQASFFYFLKQQSATLLDQTFVHIGLTFTSLCLAIIVALPLGILIAKKTQLSRSVLGFSGILQTIPSIALLGFLIPFVGIGAKPAIITLFLYALLPIVRNTYTGIKTVDAAVKDAAKGMGMTSAQLLFKVELPLAFPVILAGIRTATVINVGVATLAAYIAAGGLGEFIFSGIALNNTHMILAGAIPAALLAILLDWIISLAQYVKFDKLIRTAWLLLLSILLFASFYFLPSAYRGSLLAGFPPEFMGRNDGYEGLKTRYGLNIRTVVLSDALMYKATQEKELDIIAGYSTDGRIKAFDLRILADDKKLFPPYWAAPLIHQHTLEQYPELEPILNKLAGKINDSTIVALNYQIDYEAKSPSQVAKDFLEEQGLYREPQGSKSGVLRIGSKIFDEQYLLAHMYKMLVEGFTSLAVELKTGLGGTKLCFDALKSGQIDLYPEYIGTGMHVILQLPQQTIDSLSANAQGAFDYTARYFDEQHQLKWLEPIGFNNSYALIMRRKQSEELKVYSISDLVTYMKKR
ncbi:ABC transporter permease/substrate-binding protein [Olivibacter sp. SDN3]|uniref:ABC transporter permease/substrate-binding protein n=1 Tax=Olivibacter sp. SDN3 TaxID=2764720 RepID=UPI001650FFD7|nr:ABC transporter permease/substrate-binding protein [Olivibacter sp. SDN3]QNL49666.1 ABC transporter permease/substrate-binding protein [Olivibacter sp. SDN3]